MSRELQEDGTCEKVRMSRVGTPKPSIDDECLEQEGVLDLVQQGNGKRNARSKRAIRTIRNHQSHKTIRAIRNYESHKNHKSQQDVFDEDVSNQNGVFIMSLMRVITCLGVPDEDVSRENVDC